MSQHDTSDDERLQTLLNRSKIYIEEGTKYYEGTLNESCPKFKLRIFVKRSTHELEWASVKKRDISLLGFLEYPMKPMLNINLVMFYGYVPKMVFNATFIEEMVHLKLGFNKKDDHDEEFFNIMRNFPEFELSQAWKEQNLMMSISIANWFNMKYEGLCTHRKCS